MVTENFQCESFAGIFLKERVAIFIIIYYFYIFNTYGCKFEDL